MSVTESRENFIEKHHHQCCFSGAFQCECKEIDETDSQERTNHLCGALRDELVECTVSLWRLEPSLSVRCRRGVWSHGVHCPEINHKIIKRLFSQIRHRNHRVYYSQQNVPHLINLRIATIGKSLDSEWRISEMTSLSKSAIRVLWIILGSYYLQVGQAEERLLFRLLAMWCGRGDDTPNTNGARRGGEARGQLLINLLIHFKEQFCKWTDLFLNSLPNSKRKPAETLFYTETA